MICQCCGVEASTKHVEFSQSIGALFVFRHKQVKGNLCKSCINKYFWRFTLVSLTLGWWGVISFFLTPFFILSNLIHYLKTLKLRSVPAGVDSRESVSVGINSRIRKKQRINRTGKSHVSEFSQKSHLNPNSSKQPVRERGRVWFNSEDDQPSLPRESEPSGASSIEDLIKHLGCVNNSGFRCLAAELLGQRGLTAISAISALLIAGVDIDATVRKAALNALESIDLDWFQNSEVQKALPKLTKEFKHSYCFKKSYSEEVSKAADRLLQQIGKPAVPYLANLIVEEEDKIEYKIHAIQILKDIGSDATSAVPQLIQALSSKASQVRIAAAEALANFRTAAKAAIPEIFVGLADRDVDVRKAMLTCLVAIEAEVPNLLPSLVHKNPNVSEAVADALIQIRPQALPALTEAVLQWCTNPKADTDNFETHQKITEAVLQILGRFGRDASVAMPTISLALVDPNPTIKLAAAQALENIDRNWVSTSVVVNAITSLVGTEVAVSKFVVGLADRDADVRKAMVAYLTQLGPAANPTVPQLLPLLQDRDHNVRKAATDALIQIGPNTLPALTEAVLQWCTNSKADTDNFETHQKITEAVLQILGRFGRDASTAVPTIALALIDPIRIIRVASVQALGNIDRNWMSDSVVVDAIVNFAGTQAAVSKLVVGFVDLDAGVRKAMVVCLAQLGPAAKPAVPRLLLLLQDMDHNVRKAATDALMQIDPNTLPKLIEKHQTPLPKDESGNFSKPPAAQKPPHVPPKSSSQLHLLKRELLKLLQGDSQACQRLIELERRKNPQRIEDELYKAVIYQLERDRR